MAPALEVERYPGKHVSKSSVTQGSEWMRVIYIERSRKSKRTMIVNAYCRFTMGRARF